MRTVEGWEERLEEVIFFILALVGFSACFFLVVWGFSLLLYVFSDAEYVGDIAFIPKWIFLGTPLIFLIETEPVKRLIERIERMGGKGPRNFA